MSRNVIVASPATNQARRVEVPDGVETWGQLREHLGSILTPGVEAIASPGNQTLNRPEAQLPQGDFRLFLVPTKNKAGVTAEQANALGQEIAQAISSASAIASVAETNALRAHLMTTIENFFNVDLPEEMITVPGDDEATLALRESRRMMNQPVVEQDWILPQRPVFDQPDTIFNQQPSTVEQPF